MKSISFIKDNGKTQLYVQLYHYIIKQIMEGYIKEGDQLPSIRSLAKQINVSKTTVENAYEMLLAEGYILSKPKVGYFVDVSIDVTTKKQQKNKQVKKTKPVVYHYDFSSKSVDIDIFDISVWKKYLRNVLEMKQEIVSYGDSQGEYFLREQLASYSYRVRGVHSIAENMVIGAGIQPLLYILLGLFSQKKITIAMEEDGFDQAKRVYLDCRCEIIEIKKTKNGIDLNDLKNKDFDILYLNTTSSGEYKKRIDAKLRFSILKLAKQKNFYIIEDDHNGELYYTSRMIPAMQGFDTNEKVIYIGSFSKLLLPSIRIAYMVLPEVLRQKYYENKNSYNQTSSKIEQLTLAFYIQEGILERHLRKLRRHYLEKSNILINNIKLLFPGRKYILQEASLTIQLFGPFNNSIEDIKISAKKYKVNIQIYHDKHLLLSFSGIKKEKIEEACLLVSNICNN